MNVPWFQKYVQMELLHKNAKEEYMRQVQQYVVQLETSDRQHAQKLAALDDAHKDKVRFFTYIIVKLRCEWKLVIFYIIDISQFGAFFTPGFLR